MKKYIWSLLMIIFTALPAWADGMIGNEETFLERVGECQISTITLIVLSYILFAFISFWALFPLYRKEKKKLLSISLIFPVFIYIPFFIMGNRWSKYCWLCYNIALIFYFSIVLIFSLIKQRKKCLLTHLIYILLYILFLAVFDYADEAILREEALKDRIVVFSSTIEEEWRTVEHPL